MTDPLASNVRRLPVERAMDLFTGSPEALFDALSAASPDGFLIAAADGRLLAASERLFELWGVAAAERAEILSLGHTVAAREALQLALVRRAARELECGGRLDPTAVRVDEIPLLDGRILERHAAPTLDPDGTPTGRVVVFHDITRRKRNELALRQRVRQEAALAALGELAMNAEELLPFARAVCATAAELLSLDAAAVLEGSTILAAARLPAEEQQRALEAAAPGSPGGHLAPLGFRAALEVELPGREDGPRRLLGVYARAPRAFSLDEEQFLGTAASVLASALARADAEEELRSRERQLRAVFDGARDPMLIVAGDRVVDVNTAAIALLGESRGALAGRSLDALAPLASAAEGEGAWGRLLARGGERGEAELTLRERRRQVEVTITSGILPGRALVTLRDVTETRQLQARLALADRLASVGTLAAGVAHELNTPLAYVSANLAFVSDGMERLARLVAAARADREDVELARQVADAVRDAREGAERMRVIVRDLRTFSRGEDDDAGPVELPAVIASCLNMAAAELCRRARVVRELAPVPPVRGNAARLGQVFLNLLVNAAQAIPEGARARHQIRVVTRALADGRVAAEVRDTGCGIPPEHLSRVFDPFFTTKPPGVGTGLGLAICHGIVTGLGGTIEVESTPGSGTTIRVLLPASSRASAGVPTPPPALRPPSRARVLVVDDEPLVASVLQRTLQPEHEVIAAASARAALDLLAGGERFDAILCDLLMPEMSGMELHATLVGVGDPHARRMLFLTGGAFTAAARTFLSTGGVRCLEKPFELAALRRELSRVLASGGDERAAPEPVA